MVDLIEHMPLTMDKGVGHSRRGERCPDTNDKWMRSMESSGKIDKSYITEEKDSNIR